MYLVKPEKEDKPYICSFIDIISLMNPIYNFSYSNYNNILFCNSRNTVITWYHINFNVYNETITFHVGKPLEKHKDMIFDMLVVNKLNILVSCGADKEVINLLYSRFLFGVSLLLSLKKKGLVITKQ